MLDIRPNCECCDKDLLPDSTEAMICSYECTFCRDCVDNILSNVCPNCGGGFMPRPIRPREARREGVSLKDQPPAIERMHTQYSIEALKLFSGKVKHIPAEQR